MSIWHATHSVDRYGSRLFLKNRRDVCDNCPNDYNPLQEDTDSNGVGDACECQCDCHADPANCEGVQTVLDVVATVNVAFRNGNPATEFCDPCP